MEISVMCKRIFTEKILYNTEITTETCERAKTCMMIAVILYHSMYFFAGRDWFAVPPVHESRFIGELAIWLNTFHIFVFTFASGYLFQYLKFEAGKYPAFADFARKKMRRLLVPYLFVSIIWCMPFDMVFFHTGAAELCKHFFLGYSPAQLWYIMMLLVLFIMVYPISGFIQYFRGGQQCAVFAIVYFSGIAAGRMLALPYQIPAAIQHMAFFMLGMFVCNRRQQVAFPWYFSAIIHIVLFTLFNDIFIGALWYERLFRALARPLLNILGIFMVISFISAHRDAGLWNTKLYSFFKKHSFTMYLFHQQLIYCIISIFNGILPPFFLVTANFVAAILGSSVISVISNSFPITRFLTGTKNFRLP